MSDVPDFLSGLTIGDVSYPTILGLVIIAIIRGDLVPRRTHESTEKERDEWKRVALMALDVNDKLAKTTEVTHHVVESLPHDEGQT